MEGKGAGENKDLHNRLLIENNQGRSQILGLRGEGQKSKPF
jgi:hypothetical protein